MVATLASGQLTDEQQSRFANLIYERTGIRIPEQKKMLLSNRIKRCLKALGVDSFDKYYQRLKTEPQTAEVWRAFLQEVTTHETYLFRDESHWKWLTDEYLPSLIESKRIGQSARKIRIWSAACSTGDEVYTIACCVADFLQRASGLDFQIMGTDIGQGAIGQAKAAIFGTRAMGRVPVRYQEQFFTKVDDQRWRATGELTSLVEFRQHNLMEPFTAGLFDLILVKNVLIYFDPPSKAKVMRNIDSALRAGGLLVTGPAEGVYEQLRSYERIHPWLHRKPLG